MFNLKWILADITAEALKYFLGEIKTALAKTCIAF